MIKSESDLSKMVEWVASGSHPHKNIKTQKGNVRTKFFSSGKVRGFKQPSEWQNDECKGGQPKNMNTCNAPH